MVRTEAPRQNANREPRFGLWFVDVPKAAKRSLTMYMWRTLRAVRKREIAGLFPRGSQDRPAVYQGDAAPKAAEEES